MWFTIIDPISQVRSITRGLGVKISQRLRARYGGSRWRKMKAWLVFGSRMVASGSRRSTGMKRMGSEGRTSKSSGSSTSRREQALAEACANTRFALCVNSGETVDLDLRKVYRVMPDADALRQGLVRIVDETGEDFLYPATWFRPVALSASTARLFRNLGAT